MKKLLLSIALLAAAATCAQAQWLRVWQAGESTRYALSEASTITYSPAGASATFSGDGISIGDVQYSVSSIDSITIVNPVVITWTEAAASVEIPESVEGVTATVTGGDVVITNTNVYSEQEFILQGTSSSGSLTYNGEYKAKFHLAGVSLTSTSGAALDIQCGKRIDLILEDGTVNSLADAASGSQKAALNCQGHMEVSGGGTLSIEGNANHAFRTKEYLLLKKDLGIININKAAADGIHCGEFFTMNGGTVNISGHAKDGLQMETSADSDEEDNGIFTMNDGTITVVQTAASSKAIRADSVGTKVALMNINGGNIGINLAETATDAKGIACDGNININQSNAATNITMTIESVGYKENGDQVRTTGIKSDDTITLDAGSINIDVIGLYSRGMRAVTLIVNGGSITITNESGTQSIKLDDPLIQNGGTLTLDNSIKY